MEIPYGYCHCGCGEKTTVPKYASKGHPAGVPYRYLRAHHLKVTGPDYVVNKETGCWEWARSRDGKGYGICPGSYGHLFAHRYYYAKYNDDFRKDLFVCHKCDNPICVNPEHLVQGTHKENILDMTRKRRFNSKLTDADITHIRTLRKDGWLQAAIAKEVGVDPSQISRILSGKRWNVEPY